MYSSIGRIGPAMPAMYTTTQSLLSNTKLISNITQYEHMLNERRFVSDICLEDYCTDHGLMSWSLMNASPCVPGQHRTGLLCGKCKEGYSLTALIYPVSIYKTLTFPLMKHNAKRRDSLDHLPCHVCVLDPALAAWVRVLAGSSFEICLKLAGSRETSLEEMISWPPAPFLVTTFHWAASTSTVCAKATYFSQKFECGTFVSKCDLQYWALLSFIHVCWVGFCALHHWTDLCIYALRSFHAKNLLFYRCLQNASAFSVKETCFLQATEKVPLKHGLLGLYIHDSCLLVCMCAHACMTLFATILHVSVAVRWMFRVPSSLWSRHVLCRNIFLRRDRAKHHDLLRCRTICSLWRLDFLWSGKMNVIRWSRVYCGFFVLFFHLICFRVESDWRSSIFLFCNMQNQRKQGTVKHFSICRQAYMQVEGVGNKRPRKPTLIFCHFLLTYIYLFFLLLPDLRIRSSSRILSNDHLHGIGASVYQPKFECLGADCLALLPASGSLHLALRHLQACVISLGRSLAVQTQHHAVDLDVLDILLRHGDLPVVSPLVMPLLWRQGCPPYRR